MFKVYQEDIWYKYFWQLLASLRHRKCRNSVPHSITNAHARFISLLLRPRSSRNRNVLPASYRLMREEGDEVERWLYTYFHCLATANIGRKSSYNSRGFVTYWFVRGQQNTIHVTNDRWDAAGWLYFCCERIECTCHFSSLFTTFCLNILIDNTSM